VPIVANNSPPIRIISAVVLGENLASTPRNHWNPAKVTIATTATAIKAEMNPLSLLDVEMVTVATIEPGPAISGIAAADRILPTTRAKLQTDMRLGSSSFEASVAARRSVANDER
jgi:hypothetical protein